MLSSLLLATSLLLTASAFPIEGVAVDSVAAGVAAAVAAVAAPTVSANGLTFPNAGLVNDSITLSPNAENVTIVLDSTNITVSTDSALAIALARTMKTDLTAADGTTNVTAVGIHLDHVLHKYDKNAAAFEANTGRELDHRNASLVNPLSALRKRQKIEGLIDMQHESLWAGYVSIGDPPQNFLVDFDTGSGDAWVMAYNPTTSTNARVIDSDNQAFQIAYGDGSDASGPIYADSMSIAGAQVYSQLFSPVTNEDGFDQSPTNGIFGLSYSTISDIGAPTIFQTLYSQGGLPFNQFSLKLAPTGSELVLGGVNPKSYKGAIVYTPVTQQAYWSVTGNIWNNGVKLGTNLPLIIDSGTTLIIAPLAGAAAFFKRVSGARQSSAYPGYWEYPCNSSLHVAFSFAGPGLARQFTMNPSFMNLGASYRNSPYCVAALVGMDTGSDAWIVGDVFLRSVLTVFDLGKNQVGFATLT